MNDPPPPFETFPHIHLFLKVHASLTVFNVCVFFGDGRAEAGGFGYVLQ